MAISLPLCAQDTIVGWVRGDDVPLLGKRFGYNYLGPTLYFSGEVTSSNDTIELITIEHVDEKKYHRFGEDAVLMLEFNWCNKPLKIRPETRRTRLLDAKDNKGNSKKLYLTIADFPIGKDIVNMFLSGEYLLKGAKIYYTFFDDQHWNASDNPELFTELMKQSYVNMRIALEGGPEDE